MTLILMIIIIKIFSGIFLCTLLGTILYLFWKAVGRLIEHKGYIDINYLIWKMVLLMFAIPITLIYANGFEKSTYVFEVTGPIKWVIGILMIIWLVGTIIFTIRFLEKYRAIRKDILNADPCGDEIQSMVKSISKKLGVHKEIQVVILEKAGGPMLYGVLKPRIILSRIYDPQQLNMIFTHELIHYKHHDLIWKHLANIICCIYWFQPALKDVFYQLDQWGETYCDRTVCEYLPDVKGYFSTIIDISMEEIRYGRYTTAGLYESKEVLKLRMERMKSYRQQRRLRRGISVSVLFGMIILSATTVFASGIGFVKAYDKIADETREEINVGTEGDIKDQKAKYRMYDKTRIKKCMIKNERLKENDGKPFTWKIKPKERIETKEGHLKKGTCVQVAACMGFEEEHPETHIAIGIIDEDGEETYIENGVNLVSHLKVKKDGRYRVFLENLGAKKAIAGGHYMVITEEKMFVKKVLMIVLVSVIYLINLNIPVAAEENEQDIIFSPNWMLENGYKEEVEENQEILPFATRVNVNWKVGLKTEKKTKTFHKNAGSKITVEASVFPTKKIRIGIVAKSIGRMYVETTDMAKKTFNIKKTGEYSVFVTNKSDSTIHVVGNYTK